MELKHETHLYIIDHIYIDQASTDLYHLFFHCDICGKPIKLTVKTENDVVKWLGGIRGKWIEKTISTFPQYQPDEYECSFCHHIVNYKTNFCANCGACMEVKNNGKQ